MPDSLNEKIDIFTHISPPKYEDALYKKARPTFHKEHNELTPALVDLYARFRMMDKFEGLKQVLTGTQPPLETVVDAKDAIDLARLVNDEMADLVARFPDRFSAAVACLPMKNRSTGVRSTRVVAQKPNKRYLRI